VDGTGSSAAHAAEAAPTISRGEVNGYLSTIQIVANIHVLVWNTNNIYAIGYDFIENQVGTFGEIIVPRLDVCSFLSYPRIFR
jgi:hypothetical protein